ncbi:MAG TPA: hypothetical protein O0X70_03270 [Methanocorpusculum sp.]|nr:hypothetical protein [Methanocorpusculum sp.]
MSILNKNAEELFDEGNKLFTGAKGKTDKRKAIKLFEKAAELKHPGALYRLGMCCYLGEAIGADKEKALKYLGEAAELGSSEAAKFLAKLNGKIDDVITESKAESEAKAEPAPETEAEAEAEAEPEDAQEAGIEPLLKISQEDGKYVIRAGTATAYVSRGDCGFEIKTGSQFLRREVNIPDAIAEGRKNLEDLCFLKVVPGVNSVLESIKSIQVPYLKDAVSMIYGKVVDMKDTGVKEEAKPAAQKEYPTPVTRREYLATGMQIYVDGDTVKGLEYIKQSAKYGLLDAKELLKAENIDTEIRSRVSAA